MVIKRVLVSTLVIAVFIQTALSSSVFAASSAVNQQYSSLLPTKVQSVINSAVDVNYYNGDGSKIEKASGVKVSSNLTISAGHEFLENGPIQADGSNNYCRNLAIYSSGDKNSEFSTDNSIVATYSPNSLSANDVSIINTKGNSQYGNLPIAQIGTKPSDGNELYFVNYEPTANSFDRSPNTAQNSSTKLSEYSLPAIYNGILLDNTGNTYTIATGLNSLGIGASDNRSRPGASGGPVFNSKGQLIGIIDSIANSQLSAQQISAMYDVNISDISPYTLLQIEYIQPITQQLINEYSAISSDNNLTTNTSYCTHSPAIDLASFTKTLNKPKKQSIFQRALTSIASSTTRVLATGLKVISF